MVLDAGVSALAVHARRRHDRPRHWAQWEQFELLRDAVRGRGVPLVLNGDVFQPQVCHQVISVSHQPVIIGVIIGVVISQYSLA